MSAFKQSILVADDDAGARLVMQAALRKAGYDVRLASGGHEALQQFGAHPCDMVMLDVDMPDLDGYAVCAKLRAQAGALLPIVMVTGMDDVASVEAAYECGATDFIAKPVHWALIGHRVRYLFRSHQAMLDVHAAEARIARLAYFDSLTGLPNRHAFLERLEHEVQRARQHRGRLGVLFMDLDGFKNINDTLGHDVGDRVLVSAAERLRESVRARPRVAPADARARPADDRGCAGHHAGAPGRGRVHRGGEGHRSCPGRRRHRAAHRAVPARALRAGRPRVEPGRQHRHRLLSRRRL